MKRKLDGDSLLNEALEQLEEDRLTLLDLFQDLRNKIEGLDHYALHGQTLAKYGELLVKQTSQIVEIAKLTNKDRSKDESVLSSDDLDLANDEIVKSNLI